VASGAQRAAALTTPGARVGRYWATCERGEGGWMGWWGFGPKAE
jgi:cytochrome c biogenesis factor